MRSRRPIVRTLVTTALLVVAVLLVQPGLADAVELGLEAGDCDEPCPGDGPEGDCSSSCDACTCCPRALAGSLAVETPPLCISPLEWTPAPAAPATAVGAAARIFHPPRAHAVR